MAQRIVALSTNGRGIGPRRMPEKRGLDDAIQRYSNIDPVHGDPIDTLRRVVEVSDQADEDDLGWIAVLLIDPLLDLHWQVIADAFEAAMRQSSKLRMAYSGTMTDIPDELHSRFAALVEAEEDIGHRPEE